MTAAFKPALVLVRSAAGRGTTTVTRKARRRHRRGAMIELDPRRRVFPRQRERGASDAVPATTPSTQPTWSDIVQGRFVHEAVGCELDQATPKQPATTQPARAEVTA